ncbi:MAG: sugar ABC transporter ATP-binding protein [Desulfurococcales archaeon ex4484_204]|nr:MAG: sugar ABC transporter ATP-binding protein [Desulfurococcales archaeon ex4484_204]
MVKVTLDNVSKFFGKVRAVTDLNLEVGDGEFVALLGPSGCGKTTTLLMIAGIYRPSRGRILFDNEDVTGLPPKDRNVGMVFQSYALYPHMTVYDNIAFPLKLKKVPKQEIDRKVRKVAKLLRIDNLLARRPGQLSGGQQQRVALGRALAKEPDVLLLDEPLSNLDAKLRILMRAELKRLQKELRVTTVYVTHDQVEAMSMADRIAVMNAGKLQQYADPQGLYNKPANLFVAGFIGSPPMNFVEGSIREDLSGGYYFDAGAFKFKLPKELGELISSKSIDVVMGFRPEHVKLSLNREEYSIEGQVYVVEPLGRDIVVNVKVGDMLFKVVTKPGVELRPGQRIWLVLDVDKIHFFDKFNERAIV